MKQKILTLLVVFGSVALLPALVYAVPLTSPNYKLDPQGLNNFGGQGSSSNYRMVSSGGEAVVGSGSGGSYKLSSGYTAQLQQSIELSLTESGTVSYYPLNTNTGIQAYDATTNNNHGILTNGPTWTSGKINQALEFDGNGYVDAPTSNGNEITVSLWASYETLPSANAGLIQMGTGSASTKYVGIWVSNAGKLWGRITDSSGNRDLPQNETLTTGTFHHVVLTADGDTVRQYVNGQEVGSVSYNGTINSSSALWIGRQGSERWVGKIDEVKILDRALNATEVRNMYDANQAGVATAITIPQVTPGASQDVGMDMTVITDAGGYNASILQNDDLTHTDTTTTIDALASGDIATPALWDEGNTTGLGFTLTDGLSIPVKWGSGPVNYRYARLPESGTTFFSRTGLSGGQKETTKLQFKLDVDEGQKSGAYSNIVTVTATLKP